MQSPVATHEDSNEPFCSNCGYILRGLTESSKCPECGKPLVEVLTRRTFGFRSGKRYRSPLILFGLPLVDIAFGPSGSETFGRARGIIACGDTAKGWLAIGGRAIGLIAIGGMAIGVVAVGGGAIGAIAIGGGAIGLLCAVGGGAAGLIGAGGGSIGYIAQGGSAVGVWVRAQDGAGVHLLTAVVRDPRAIQFFGDWSWLLGGPPPTGMWVLPAWIMAFSAGFALILAAVAFAGYLLKTREITDESARA
jgi:predicted RNA-binding Zn-ribbon protein involved in translation (DUF1610 family)